MRLQIAHTLNLERYTENTMILVSLLLLRFRKRVTGWVIAHGESPFLASEEAIPEA
jgi:hypothetical protein